MRNIKTPYVYSLAMAFQFIKLVKPIIIDKSQMAYGKEYKIELRDVKTSERQKTVISQADK